MSVVKNVTSNFYLNTIWYSQSDNAAKYVQKPLEFNVGYDFSKFNMGGNNGGGYNWIDPCEVDYQANQAEKDNFVINDPQPRSAIKWGESVTLNVELPSES